MSAKAPGPLDELFPLEVNDEFVSGILLTLMVVVPFAIVEASSESDESEDGPEK